MSYRSFASKKLVVITFFLPATIYTVMIFYLFAPDYFWYNLTSVSLLYLILVSILAIWNKNAFEIVTVSEKCIRINISHWTGLKSDTWEYFQLIFVSITILFL